MERCLKIAGASNIVYGAFADDKLIGIAGFAANQSEIIQFYVDAQHRGRGTGRKLLSVLIDDIFTRFKVWIALILPLLRHQEMLAACIKAWVLCLASWILQPQIISTL